MKKSILLMIFMCSVFSYAQVGINTLSPNASLDIKASNVATPLNTDGVLIPRINAFPVTNPGADQDAMLVYLNVVSGTNLIGFYYWNNATTTWIPLGDNSDAWELSGNTGTTNGTDFLGTTDNQALDIRTNNVIKARITTKGQIEILNTGNSVLIGENAGAASSGSNNRMTAIGTDAASSITNDVHVTAVGYQAGRALTGFASDGNSAFGSGAMLNATTGQNNTVIGHTAMYFNTNAGNFNTAIGYRSMGSSSFSGGDRNTGVGGYTLEFSDGDFNTGLGYGASRNLEAGDNNTTLGYQSDYDTQNGSNNVSLGYQAGGLTGAGAGYTRSNNVFIGAESGTGESNSNRLHIESSSSVTPLVYGEFDNDILRIGGQLQIGSSDDASAGSIYAFPTTDGSAGQVLTTNGSGVVSWASASGGADTQDLSINNTNATVSLVDGGSVIVSTIADADADTKIQVEESANEDIIRFDAGGNEHFTMNNKGQLQVYNTGRSVFVGEGAGANDDLSNNDNVFMGYNAATTTTTGAANVAIGPNALAANTTGSGSVAIGNSTLSAAVSSSNIAIGNSALAFGTTPSGSVGIGTSALLSANGNFNTGIGNFALSNSSTGNQNTSLGNLSGVNLNGDNNIAVGFKADQFNHGGDRNIVIGAEAGMLTGGSNDNDGNVLIGHNAAQNIATDNSLYIENSSSVTPLIYGEFDNDVVRIGGQLQVGSSDDTTAGSIYAFPTVDGTVGQALVTDGSGNVSWGTVSGGGADTQDLSIDNTTATVSLVDGGSVVVSTIADADSDTKVQVEESADEDIIRLDLAGTETVTFEGATINTKNTGFTTFLGDGAGASGTLAAITRTTFVGYEAGNTVTSGIWNTAVGYQALKGNITGGSNTMVGYQAGFNTTTNDNIGVGRWSLRGNTSGGRNIGIGTSNSSYVIGTKNIAIGNGSMAVSNSGIQNLSGNIAIGSGAGFTLRDAIGNIAIGEDSADFLENGDYNVIIGHEAGSRINNGSTNNIMIGRQVGGNSALIADKRTFKNSILLGFNAGYLEDEGSEDRLYIEQSGSRIPLIGGDFSNDRIGINIDMTTTTPGVGVAPDALTHTLTVGGSVKVQTLMNLEPTTAPTTPDRGDVYYDDATNKVKVWTGSAWENLN